MKLGPALADAPTLTAFAAPRGGAQPAWGGPALADAPTLTAFAAPRGGAQPAWGGPALAGYYCVGLTGGVGCGKSTAAGMFASRGASVVDTDALAHALTSPAGAALPAIAAAFGREMIAQDGSLDRASMRRLVFTDVAARQTLERILHPLIRAEALRQAAAATHAPYVLLIVPLLLENLADYCQTLARIAVVDCDEGQQIERTASRPGVSLEQARAILAAQSPRAARLAIADDLIENSGGLAELKARVGQLHTFYLGHPVND